MRGSGLGGSGSASGLDDDDWLGQRDFAGGGEERPRVADGFHVDDDRVRPRVIAEVADEVAPVDVEHRADGNEGAEADHFLDAPVEHGRTKRAALADERDVARTRDSVREGSIQALDRVHDPEAVWADDAHLALDDPRDLVLELLAVLSELFEAGGNDDAGRDAFIDCFLDQTRD